MGLRFRKSVSLGKGLRLNFGKKGMSVTTGVKGAHVTYSTTGRKTTSVGIPGTGISYVKSGKIGGSSRKDSGSGAVPPPDNYNAVMGPAPGQPPKSGDKKRGCGTIALIAAAVIVFLIIISYACSGGGNSSSSSVVPAVAAPSKITSSSKMALSSSVSSNPQTSSSVSSVAPSPSKSSSTAQAKAEAPAISSGITVTDAAGTVEAGSNASITIKGKPSTRYTISVYYSNGASTANGLEAQNSDSSGSVTWSWKVGPKTKAGTHRIVIEGGGDKLETNFVTTAK